MKTNGGEDLDLTEHDTMGDELFQALVNEMITGEPVSKEVIARERYRKQERMSGGLPK